MSVMTHTITVRQRQAVSITPSKIVQHGLNSDRLRFVLDSDWDGYDAYTVVLLKEPEGDSIELAMDDSREVDVPSSMMDTTGKIRFTVKALTGDSTRLVTARTGAQLRVVRSGEIDDDDSELTDEELSAVELAIAKAERAEAAAAKLDELNARLEAAVEKAEKTANTDYSNLTNKPQINTVELTGNKSFGELGMAEIAAEDITKLL